MADIKINHLAIVVDSVDESLGFWRDALGLTLNKTEDVPAEEVTTAFLDVGGATIELVEPTTEDSGIARYKAKRGTGMHHICLEVEDLRTTLAQLAEKGVELINETPREREGHEYAFIHPRSTGGVLVELYEALSV